MKRLGQFVDEGRPFFEEDVAYDEGAVRKHLEVPGMRAHLTALASRFSSAQPFSQTVLEAVLRGTAEERGVKPASMIHAARVAVTGRAVSPGLFEVLELLGSRRVGARLTSAAALASE